MIRNLVLMVVATLVAIFLLYRFIVGAVTPKNPDKEKAAPIAGDRRPPASPGSGGSQKITSSSAASDEWRISGYVQREGVTLLVLRSSEGRYRFVYDPPSFRARGIDSSAFIDGSGVAPWTGKGGAAAPAVPVPSIVGGAK